MLAIILLFLRVFAINPIQADIDACKALGKDLIACDAAAKCKFYEISNRRAWDLQTTLHAAVETEDGSSYSWYEANITSIFGDQITVSLSGCLNFVGGGIPCSVTANRYSFTLRDVTPQEFVGMRIEVWRAYYGRWIHTNLTSIEDDDWNDLWAYGGEFGDMVGLGPFDVRASVEQDCQLNPDEIPLTAVTLAEDAGQVSVATYCTQIYDPEICSDDYNLNCEWDGATNVCLLNAGTNNLVICSQHGSESACISDIRCKWLKGDRADQADSMCMHSSAKILSISLLTLLLLLFYY